MFSKKPLAGSGGEILLNTAQRLARKKSTRTLKKKKKIGNIGQIFVLLQLSREICYNMKSSINLRTVVKDVRPAGGREGKPSKLFYAGEAKNIIIRPSLAGEERKIVEAQSLEHGHALY